MDSHSLKEQMLDSHRCFQKYGKTPKSSILIGFSIINIYKPSILGVPVFLETSISSFVFTIAMNRRLSFSGEFVSSATL